MLRANAALPRVVSPIHRTHSVRNLIPHQVVRILVGIDNVSHHRRRACRLAWTHLVRLLVLRVLLGEFPAYFLDHPLRLTALFLNMLALHFLDYLALDLFNVVRQ